MSAYLKGEYGQRGILFGVPAVVNRNGVREVSQMDLNQEEKAKFAASADVIHEMMRRWVLNKGKAAINKIAAGIACGFFVPQMA